MLPQSQVEDLLSTSTSKLNESILKADSHIGDIRDEMEQLKINLYARFGKSINLET